MGETTTSDIGGTHRLTEIHQVVACVITGKVQQLPLPPVVVAVGIDSLGDLTRDVCIVQLVHLAYMVEIEIDMIDIHVAV